MKKNTSLEKIVDGFYFFMSGGQTSPLRKKLWVQTRIVEQSDILALQNHLAPLLITDNPATIIPAVASKLKEIPLQFNSSCLLRDIILFLFKEGPLPQPLGLADHAEHLCLQMMAQRLKRGSAHIAYQIPFSENAYHSIGTLLESLLLKNILHWPTSTDSKQEA